MRRLGTHSKVEKLTDLFKKSQLCRRVANNGSIDEKHLFRKCLNIFRGKIAASQKLLGIGL